MFRKIMLFFFISLCFLYSKENRKSQEQNSLAFILLKAKETNNIELKKKLLKESFKIKPTLYAIKMLLTLNKNNPSKCLQIIDFAYGIFPLNKYLTIKGIQFAFKTNKLNKAEYYIFNYLKQYPLDKDVLYYLAEYYKKTGNIDSAIRVFKTIYKLYGDKKALKYLKQANSIFN